MSRASVLRSCVAGLLAAIVAGCATVPPPAPEPAPTPREEPVGVNEPVAAEPTPCACDEPNREIVRLRRELAAKEAELRDLRVQHRDQIKALQEAARRAARAMAKIHRNATRTDAVSYIAEVEVELRAMRSSPDHASKASLLDVADSMLQSSTTAFKRNDYGGAMNRAVQAQQLVTMLADSRSRLSQTNAAAEIPFLVPIPLRLKTDSNLRRQPRRNAKVIVVLKESTPLVAVAYRGNWLHVDVNDRHSGWVHQGLFAVQ